MDAAQIEQSVECVFIIRLNLNVAKWAMGTWEKLELYRLLPHVFPHSCVPLKKCRLNMFQFETFHFN